MRRGLELVRVSAATGDVDPIHVAMLEDRIRTFSGLPQRYGTQFDWDEYGVMNPRPIEDAEPVDERRRAIGLPPLAEKLAEIREATASAGDRDPSDAAARRREIDEWERSVGWHP
jgi:predicted nucleic acid-binding Zn ribbon protein